MQGNSLFYGAWHSRCEALFQACISKHLGRSPASEAIAEMKCAQLESQSISVVTTPRSPARRSRSQARLHLQLLWDCDVLSTNLFEAPPAGKLGKMLSVQGGPSGAMRRLNTAFTVSPTKELHDAWIPLFSRQSARQTANNHGRMNLRLWRWSEDAVPMNLRSRPLSPIRFPPVDDDFLFFRRVRTASNLAF